MATIDVKDAANTTQTLERPLPPGQAAMAASRPVAIASNQSAVPISGTVAATQSGTWGNVTEDAASTADPIGPQIMARRRDTLTASEVSADSDTIALNATSKGQLHTLAQIDPAQLGAIGPQTKAASTSVTLATDENAKGRTQTQVVTSATTQIVAPGASGVRRNLYAITMSNTTAAVQAVTIRDGTDVVIVWQVPPTDTRGLTLDCNSAIPQTSAATEWTAAVSPLASGSVHITALWVER